MTHHFKDGGISEERAAELLHDIEASHALEIQNARQISSRSIKSDVSVTRADVHRRDETLSTGTATELQRNGVSCMLLKPVLPGSALAVTIADLDLEPQMVVCTRCSMLGDHAFETHFRFVREIDLSVVVRGN